MGGERAEKSAILNAPKIVFCPGVLGFATPIGSTSACVLYPTKLQTELLGGSIVHRSQLPLDSGSHRRGVPSDAEPNPDPDPDA